MSRRLIFTQAITVQKIGLYQSARWQHLTLWKKHHNENNCLNGDAFIRFACSADPCPRYLMIIYVYEQQEYKYQTVRPCLIFRWR